MSRILLSAAVFFSLVLFLAAEGASAQTVSSSSLVSATSTPSTGTIAPGTQGATLGTIELSGLQSGTVQLSSIPLTLSTGNGASASGLSNCQLFNASGTALTTGSNMPSSVQSGTNTFTFDTPLALTQGSPMTLSVRCNVSSSSPSGGTFQFSAGIPTLSTGLGVNFTPATNVPRSGNNLILGFVTLNGARSGGNVNVSSIPLTVTLTGGATNTSFSNCALRNVVNISTSLNTGANAVGNIGSGVSTFTFDTPLSVPAGGIVALALTCNVTGPVPAGATALVSLNPSTVTSTVAGTGSALTPTVGLTSGGALGTTSGTVTFFQGTATPTPTTPTPGVPNTGAGGQSLPVALGLISSGIALLAGLRWMRRYSAGA